MVRYLLALLLATKASHKMAEAMYQRAQSQQQAASAQGAGEQAEDGDRPAEGEVVDAEFEDLGGGKKTDG